MNFQVTLMMVYLFGEFGYLRYVENAATYFEVPGDSPEKLVEVKRATDEIKELMSYRHSVEAPLRTNSRENEEEFEKSTGLQFDANTEPEVDKPSKTLWKAAKTLLDKYNTERLKFENDKLCDPPLSDFVCPKAFENNFFKTENLTFDESKQSTGDGCINVPYSMQFGNLPPLIYTMKYKSCFAKKENGDGTISSVVVYLQLSYKQPLLGKWRYFIILPYVQNPDTGLWERPSNLDDVANINYRYESFTNL